MFDLIDYFVGYYGEIVYDDVFVLSSVLFFFMVWFVLIDLIYRVFRHFWR